MKQSSYRLAAVIAAGLLVAACGSSSSTSKGVPAANAPATPSTGTSISKTRSATTVVAKKHGKLGTILAAGPKKLTVYMFEGDSGSASHCAGPCAKAWPPVTVSGTVVAAPPAQTALLGTTSRSDGTKQLTYKGHPVYYFIKDKDDGDAYGEGAKAFGASWYALAPSGKKINNS